MNQHDRDAIRAALAYLPRECRYHGPDFEREGIVSDGACCDTGRMPLARQRAAEALERADREARP